MLICQGGDEVVGALEVAPALEVIEIGLIDLAVIGECGVVGFETKVVIFRIEHIPHFRKPGFALFDEGVAPGF